MAPTEKPSSVEIDTDVVVMLVSELTELFDAYDEADGDASDAALKKKAVKDTVKAKGGKTDAFTTVCRLRKMPLADAQAWLEAVNMYAEGAGITAPLVIKHDTAPAGSTVN